MYLQYSVIENVSSINNSFNGISLLHNSSFNSVKNITTNYNGNIGFEILNYSGFNNFTNLNSFYNIGHGILSKSNSGFNVINNSFNIVNAGFNDNGLRITDSGYYKVYNINLTNNVNVGLSLYNSVRNAEFENITTKNNGAEGISGWVIRSCSFKNILIDNNTAEGFYYGYSFCDMDNMTISNNGADGISFDESAGTFINSKIYNNGGYGMASYYRIRDGSFSNLTIYDNNKSGMYLCYQMERNIFSNIDIYNNREVGLYLDCGEIFDNVFTDFNIKNNSRGIYMYSKDRWNNYYFVSNNTFSNMAISNNQQEAILLDEIINTTIVDSNIFNNSMGIWINNSNTTIIKNTQIVDNNIGLNITFNSNNNSISYNDFNSILYDVSIETTPSNTTLHHNTFRNSSYIFLQLPFNGYFHKNIDGVDYGNYSGSEEGYVLKFDSNLNPIWGRYIGSDQSDVVNYMKVDNYGNVYAAGYVSNAVTDDDINFRGNFTGNTEGYLTKFDNDGNVLWSQFIGDGDSSVFSIGVDGFNNIIASGYSRGSSIDDGIVSFNGTHSGSDEAFLVKFDQFGNSRWGSWLGTGDTAVYDIKFDDKNNLILGGHTNGNIAEGFSAFNGTYSGLNESYIAKIDRNGNPLWGHWIGGAGEDHLVSISVYNNEIIATGYTQGSLDDGLGTFNGSHTGGHEGLFIKFDPVYG